MPRISSNKTCRSPQSLVGYRPKVPPKSGGKPAICKPRGGVRESDCPAAILPRAGGGIVV